MKVLRGLRIELFVEQREERPAVNPVIAALLHQLVSAGANTNVRTPEVEIVDPRRTRADVILLKSAHPVALATALAAERAGAVVVNSAAATIRANDKAAVVAALAAAGVRVPETLLADGSCTDAYDGTGAWIAKPVRGLHGAGIHAGVSYREAMAGVAGLLNGSAAVDDRARIVQRPVGGDSVDVKVYVVGERIFAGRKRFRAASYRSNEIRPLEPTADLREMALAAGAALDLTVFGVDLREEGTDLYVVDVNPFPGYRGFPDAAPPLRDEIARQAACA